LCDIIFLCIELDQDQCVYYQKSDIIPCAGCETYIENKKPPFEDYCHACDKMYEWNRCKHYRKRMCYSTVACVNKSVLFLKEVGLTVENLQSICTK